MPEGVEKAFANAGLSLFPERRGDLATECFDRDPFLVFKLRGMAREELVGLLGALPSPAGRGVEAPLDEGASAPPEPLRTDPGAFWAGGELPADPFGDVSVPATAAALVRRLGPFPFWRGTASLIETVEPAYAQASPRGLDVFLGTGGLSPASAGSPSARR